MALFVGLVLVVDDGLVTVRFCSADNNGFKMDTLHLAHLDWMFENEPHLVLSLAKQGKLLGHLQRIRDQANKVELGALAAGRPEDEAHEIMLAYLCPPDGPALTQDQPPEPVPYEEQELIMQWLDEQEARDGAI